MKWWKRLLRRRIKRALGFKELQRAFRFGSVMYRIVAGVLVFSKTLQRRETKMVLRMFGRMLSKRY